MFVPISPTNTSCLVSSFPTTITCQVALKNSLASAVPASRRRCATNRTHHASTPTYKEVSPDCR